MTKAYDLTGQKFGRLIALERAPSRYGKTMWRCMCDCGREHITHSYSMTRGKVLSCGCLHKELMSAAKRKHGGCRLPEYIVWHRMRSRCASPRDKSYPSYGGRGIKVCDRWNSFENFLSDMGPRPSEKHSIDRINNDGDYCPENCRWTTADVQANNRRARSNITRVEYAGRTMTLREWAQELGLQVKTLQWRFAQGWRGDRLFHQVGPQIS